MTNCMIGRMTPPGGLGFWDFLLMLCLPIGAVVAGLHWHNIPVFFFYGGLGMLFFIPGYMSNSRLYLNPRSTIVLHAIAWTISVFFSAVVCTILGKLANDPELPWAEIKTDS